MKVAELRERLARMPFDATVLADDDGIWREVTGCEYQAPRPGYGKAVILR